MKEYEKLIPGNIILLGIVKMVTTALFEHKNNPLFYVILSYNNLTS